MATPTITSPDLTAQSSDINQANGLRYATEIDICRQWINGRDELIVRIWDTDGRQAIYGINEDTKETVLSFYPIYEDSLGRMVAELMSAGVPSVTRTVYAGRDRYSGMAFMPITPLPCCPMCAFPTTDLNIPMAGILNWNGPTVCASCEYDIEDALRGER